MHASHTIFAALLQFDTLYWPIAHTEQLVQVEMVVMPNPVEYLPVWHVWQAREEFAPVPVWNVPAWQSVQFVFVMAARPVE